MKLGPNALAVQPQGKLNYPFPVTFKYNGMFAPIYHPYGWCYQRFSAWYGTIWRAIRYTKPSNPQTGPQQAWRAIFARGINIWTTEMTDDTKDIYNKRKYPERMSGCNRWMSLYLKDSR